MPRDDIKTLVSDLKNHLKGRDEVDLLYSVSSFGTSSSQKKPVKKPVSVKKVLPNNKNIESVLSSPQKTCAQNSEENSPDNLEELKKIVSNCKKCNLGNSRLNAVFGVGSPNAKIMFVGEGPGFDEDHKGEPFVGRAGKLLDKILLAMGLKREDVYIANIVKCHPMVNAENPEARGNDRPPNPDEFEQCIPYLEKQISIIQPDFVVCLGAVSAKVILGVKSSLTSLREVFHDYPKRLAGVDKNIKVLVTYHPAALLRNPNWKVPAWADMKMLMKALNIPLQK
ncbi:MAG TPA: uracil-DNA glycosylase [Elusimicrobiales bacterium]|nr:uracil-DNA glycosylase [Elusimicrobiales bacterium]